MERLIPVRVTAFRDCVETPCDAQVSVLNIQNSIATANRIYAPAGIQLYLEQFDEVDSLLIQLMFASGAPVTFSNIRDDLRKVFPQMPLDAFNPGTMKTMSTWMNAVQAIYEDNRRLHIWVTFTGETSEATYPLDRYTPPSRTARAPGPPPGGTSVR